MMLMASGANFGVRRTLPHWFGIGIGFTAMIVLVGIGLIKIFALPRLEDRQCRPARRHGRPWQTF